MKAQLTHIFEEVIAVENLLDAWQEFIRGKRKRQDVQEFQMRLMDNIFALHHDLANRAYRHGGYHAFNISDPKPRIIHKASVRDRLLHHALYRKLYPFFDKTFIADSYSCRVHKGTHKSLNRFREFGYIVSKNNTRTCQVLKCDIKKFFANIDHAVLMKILHAYIPNAEILWLLENVIESFSSARLGIGLPLGNLTSQLLVNIYMNEFDQWVKHKLKAAHYIRYADDFVIISEDRGVLEKRLPLIRDFLHDELKLELHPHKVSIQTLASGIDFLGWVHFPDHRVLRTSTRRRMFRGIKNAEGKTEIVQSYLGLMGHGNTRKLQAEVEMMTVSFTGSV